MDSLFTLDWERLRSELTSTLATWGPRVVGALLVFIAGWFIARSLRKTIRRVLARTALDATLVPFLAALVYYGTLTMTLLAAIRLVGVDTTSLIAVLGAAGLAIALAFQGTLSNFAAGIMILLFRPFRVGDVVEIGGDTGAVDEVSLFSTRLNTADNVRIIVPNSKVWGERIKNFTANPTRRIDLVVGVSYDDDVAAVRELLLGIITSEERVLKDPEPVVEVLELADSSVNFAVRPWCTREDYWPLRFDLMRRIKVEVEAAGFSIPFPQRDLHFKGEMPELRRVS
jgi:small conductance mechanosensitive channel